MTHVLVLVTVFYSSSGLQSETAFQQFHSLDACERAAQAIRAEIRQISGTLGREVVAQCHAQGTPASGEGMSR